MKYDDCECKMPNDSIGPVSNNIGSFSNSNCNNCNMPIRRHLEPILIARIYNQPIIEEVPYSAMSFTLNNTASISNAHSDIIPVCANDCCNDGFNYTF